ncbi:glycosyltransferase family 32 protein [Xenorhabdus ishibashii]|uniref:Dot/Icm type IV secretion system effector SetA n=1 Tax=Xenorhabdus ishibashii TaxID=1034471 RepID=A0A2D0KCJ7_9GAMM|nr:glycosyltransferase [Xenorhabdus ishibashii]PHM61102.1 Dot/Icm type IV secretion system effector SetA [Xenorhabdus ishibashii]
MNIPKKIHYFWAGSEIPEDFLRNIINVKAENPNFEIHLWGPKNDLFFKTIYSLKEIDVDINQLFKTGYHFHDSKDIDKAFFSLNGYMDKEKIRCLHSVYHRQLNGFYHNYASASDIARLVILFAQGGIYLDVDVELASSFPKFLSDDRSHNIDQILERKAIFGNIEISDEIAFGDVSGANWTIENFGNAIVAAPAKSRKIIALLIKMENRLHILHVGVSKGWENWRKDPDSRRSETIWAMGPGLYSDWIDLEERGPSAAKRPRMENENTVIPPAHLRIEKEGEVMFNIVDARAKWGELPARTIIDEKTGREVAIKIYPSESPFNLKSSYKGLLRKK